MLTAKQQPHSMANIYENAFTTVLCLLFLPSACDSAEPIAAAAGGGEHTAEYLEICQLSLE